MPEIWCVWELKGATDGATRGVLKTRVEQLERRGWELSLNMAVVGSDGYWPANMVFWRLPDRTALTAWLNAGLDDGLDETGLTEGLARLYGLTRGDLDPAHRAFLIEYIVADDEAALAGIQGADLLLAEIMAPWQGLAVWGASDMRALAQREWDGAGASGQPGVRQATGWWNVVPAEREMV
jgi:hypothetical protein